MGVKGSVWQTQGLECCGWAWGVRPEGRKEGMMTCASPGRKVGGLVCRCIWEALGRVPVSVIAYGVR